MCHLKNNIQGWISYKKVKKLVLYLRITDHQLEIVVVVNTSTQVFIIVLELLNRHNAVLLMGLPHGHEVTQHLLLGLLTALEVWVEAHIISNLNVLQVHLSTAVLIEYGIGLVDHVEAACIELPSDGPQELIKGQLSILVGVEVLHNLGHLNL